MSIDKRSEETSIHTGCLSRGRLPCIHFTTHGEHPPSVWWGEVSYKVRGRKKESISVS